VDDQHLRRQGVSYRLSIPRRVGKQIGSLQPRDRNRVDAAILALEEDPWPHGSTKLQGRQDEYRIRVGDYRIVYAVDDEAELVEVLRVAHRREVYRRR
jgi:mRNA interferase RelE/StbE